MMSLNDLSIMQSTPETRRVASSLRLTAIGKQKPSAFFGTLPQSHLTLLGCDSLVITGGTTSGCVRATVVDAVSANYRLAVVADEATR
jgi:nicotinamidase-related amidase